MVDMKPFSLPVHRSLLQREMIGGIPQMGILLLFMLAVIFIYGLRLYYTAIPISLLYFVLRHLSKQDPWFIEIIMDNVMQKDRYLP
jgi:type IV secretory pathway TrbD component